MPQALYQMTLFDLYSPSKSTRNDNVYENTIRSFPDLLLAILSESSKDASYFRHDSAPSWLRLVVKLSPELAVLSAGDLRNHLVQQGASLFGTDNATYQDWLQGMQTLSQEGLQAWQVNWLNWHSEVDAELELFLSDYTSSYSQSIAHMVIGNNYQARNHALFIDLLSTFCGSFVVSDIQNLVDEAWRYQGSHPVDSGRHILASMIDDLNDAMGGVDVETLSAHELLVMFMMQRALDELASYSETLKSIL